MTQTVLITGTSSGFGEAATRYFAEHGWNVIATMRDTSKGINFSGIENVEVLKLDVQDVGSIQAAIDQGISRFGRIDVVINNAGYGLFGVFEGAPREAIQNQFDVNVFGMMNMVRAVLPHFRANKAGTIVNVSSGAGAIGFPMASLYCASKFALEGFSEALSYELGSLGIKVKVIEPGGAGATNFMARVDQESASMEIIPDYLPWLEKVGAMYAGMQGASDKDAVDKVVASIFEAATDGTDQLRYTPTDDIAPILKARRSTSEADYRAITLGIFPSKLA